MSLPEQLQQTRVGRVVVTMLRVASEEYGTQLKIQLDVQGDWPDAILEERRTAMASDSEPVVDVLWRNGLRAANVYLQTEKFPDWLVEHVTMSWFGPAWDSPLTNETLEIPTPGEGFCWICETQFAPTARGLRYVSGEYAHLSCHLVSILGQERADAVLAELDG